MVLHRAICIALVTACLGFATQVQGKIWYVDKAAQSGGTGASWNKAFRSLQSALKKAEAGDKIRVARGTYRPASKTGSRNATFKIREGVAVQGGYAGVKSGNPNKLKVSQYKTILSGDLKANDGSSANPPASKLKDNVYHVVTFKNVSSAAQLRGVTITGGNANGTDFEGHTSHGAGVRIIGSIGGGPLLKTCVIRRNRATWSGAGLYGPQASPIIRLCTIRDNMVPSSGAGGGGVEVAGGVIDQCLFRKNDAGIASAVGGAIRVGSSGATITNCTFEQNASSAVHCGAGTVIRGCDFTQNSSEDGGAITIAGANVGIIDCGFTQNVSSSFGGAVYALPNASAQVINSEFFENASLEGNAVANRGLLTLVNCVLVGNQSFEGFGGRGAVFNHSGELMIINCTIAHNKFQDGPGAGVHNEGGHTSIVNSVLWGNVGELPGEQSQVFASAGTIAIDFSCVQGWTGALGGMANFGANPQFVDANGPDNDLGTADDNVRLQSDSGCVNSGNTSALPADSFDIDDDGDTMEAIPLDAEFSNRVAGSAIDIGAFEH
jgi:predicted outer membrane repeat protein